MLIRDKGIDRKNREERRKRAVNRRQHDIQSGLIKVNTGPQRGDYSLCRDLDKTISDYHKFKNPEDRAKIQSEYFGKQREYI